MVDKKFSEFSDGGSSQAGDIIVGLRSGVNTQFTAGGYQPNAGALIHDFSSDGNLTLINPAPQTITALGQSDDTSYIQFPVMDATNSWKAGANVIKIKNNSSIWPIDLRNSDGDSIYTIPAGLIAEVWVISNAITAGIFSVQIYSPTVSTQNYQINNGFYQLDLGSSDQTLTNPLPTILYLINQVVDGRIVTLPTLLDPDSVPEGTSVIKIINAGYGSVVINNFSGNGIATIPYGGTLELSVTTNASEFGWYVNYPLQAYNNLADLSDLNAARNILGLPQNYYEIDTTSSNVTLTNPLPNNINIIASSATNKVILPPMNVGVAFNIPGSIPIGANFWIQNSGSVTQSVYADDGTTKIYDLVPDSVSKFTLTDNGTSNGSFNVNSSGTNAITNGQPNGGVLTYDFSASGNLVLTNPMPTLIYLTNANTTGYTVKYPAMNVPSSMQAGATVQYIWNNSGEDIDIKNNSGTVLATLKDGNGFQINIISNSTADGQIGFDTIGTAAAKNATRTSFDSPYVASQYGSSVVGNIPMYQDTLGTIEDSGLNLDGFLTNGGVLTHDFSSSGNLVLTNPSPNLIYLTNANTTGYSLKFPDMSQANAWPAGLTTPFIWNNSGQAIDIKNFGGTILTSLANGKGIQVNVISNSSANGQFGLDTIGSAQSKTATRSASDYLASVYNSTTIGNIPTFQDTVGTIQDSGISPSSLISNGGILTWDYAASGNLTLTNPPPNLIYLTNANTTGYTLTYPAMNATGSWPAGLTSPIIWNNSGQDITIKNNGGSTVATLLNGYGAQLNIQSNATANGTIGINTIGSAGAKAATRTLFDAPYVSSVYGSTTVGNIPTFKDTLGTIEDTGINVLGTQDMVSVYGYPAPTSGAQMDFVPGLSNNSVIANNFAQSQTLSYYIQAQMPKRWDKGTISVELLWSCVPTTGNVVWSVSALVVPVGTTLDGTFGTAVNVTTAAQGTARAQNKSTASTITPAGTPDSNATNKLFVKITRAAGTGSDTLAGNAYLTGFNILWTADKGNDA